GRGRLGERGLPRPRARAAPPPLGERRGARRQRSEAAPRRGLRPGDADAEGQPAAAREDRRGAARAGDARPRGDRPARQRPAAARSEDRAAGARVCRSTAPRRRGPRRWPEHGGGGSRGQRGAGVRAHALMAVTPVVQPGWLTAGGTLALDRPLIAGILNVTPDSFHDGGRHATTAAAVAHAERLLADGADILDVGGESTRPGARPVDAVEERARVVPVVEAVVRRFPDVPISVDTVKADVARAALDAGAAIINDVSGLRLDPALGTAVAAAGAGIVLMHSRGTVATMASYALAEY